LQTSQLNRHFQTWGRRLPQQTAFTENELNALIDEYLSKLGSVGRTRIYEASAIAFYHQQSTTPVIQTLLCDDAPQFKLITSDLALCWVHVGEAFPKGGTAL
jgi:hypothetical protein